MDNRNKVLAIILLFTSYWASAQYRYMVYFSDKDGASYSVNDPIQFLTQRAIDRRAKQGIAITEEDLPVTSAYVSGVSSLPGVSVLYSSKWLNGVLVQCDPAMADDIRALPYVTKVVYAANAPVPSGRLKSSKKFQLSFGTKANTDVQLSISGLDQMHNAGIHGEGMFIAIMDGGFPGANTAPQLQHVFNDSRIDLLSSYNFAYHVSNVFGYDPGGHGTAVWSIMAGHEPGTFVGGAYKANYVLFVTEDVATEYRVEEYNWLFAAERADSLGVDVINTSLGYNTFDDDTTSYAKAQMDGETAVITRAATIAANKGMIVVVAAGNEGGSSWNIITAPADSKRVIAVGSVSSSLTKASSSSVGPTADGRIKPDICAMGVGVSVVQSNGNLGTVSGTSAASPLMASLAAGVWQTFPELTADQVIDTLRHTASIASNPNNLIGYGIANYQSLFTITSSERPQSQKQSLFPNPAGESVRVELPMHTHEVNSVSLTSANGQQSSCTFKVISDDTIEIDLADKPVGVYIIKIYGHDLVLNYKLVKID